MNENNNFHLLSLIKIYHVKMEHHNVTLKKEKEKQRF